MSLDFTVIFDESDKSCQIMDVVIPKDGRVRLRKKKTKKLKSIKTLREKFQN